MATFVVIPGGGDSPPSWDPVGAAVRDLGHAFVAVDLPLGDPAAGWAEYTDAAARAAGAAEDLVVVGHSLGGFTAPLLAARSPARLLVLVAGMIPTPRARAASYWRDGGYPALASFDDEAFYHDVPPDLRSLGKRAERDQVDRTMDEPWPLDAWPAVPVRYLLCRDDRVLPADTTRRLVRERLDLEPDEIESGHCVHLARPLDLARRLDAYARR